MSSEFTKIKNILELAEVLTDEFEDSLLVETVRESTGEVVTVKLQFKNNGDLESIYVE